MLLLLMLLCLLCYTGKGVHVVTVNQYLATRDSEWMGRVYTFLGLTVGLIKNDSTPVERRDAYASDLTYISNLELCFDYLRDGMESCWKKRVPMSTLQLSYCHVRVRLHFRGDSYPLVLTYRLMCVCM